jgi:hypothetical protein
VRFVTKVPLPTPLVLRDAPRVGPEPIPPPAERLLASSAFVVSISLHLQVSDASFAKLENIKRRMDQPLVLIASLVRVNLRPANRAVSTVRLVSPPAQPARPLAMLVLSASFPMSPA